MRREYPANMPWIIFIVHSCNAGPLMVVDVVVGAGAGLPEGTETGYAVWKFESNETAVR